uniref:Putative transposase n=1 Tax=Oryza sativa subsp. japonica TaxID=39947 RepID=Q8H7K5_ORYSJ|nr:Putative transposase [Oryza sativa Japonica Group]
MASMAAKRRQTVTAQGMTAASSGGGQAMAHVHEQRRTTGEKVQRGVLTGAQDKKSMNQNSDICIDAIRYDWTTSTYYGAIDEIWELHYGPLNVNLFRCQWVRLTGGGITIDDYGMTTVDLNKIGYLDKPFVLANDVTQVFYVKDICLANQEGERARRVKVPRGSARKKENRRIRG